MCIEFKSVIIKEKGSTLNIVCVCLYSM